MSTVDLGTVAVSQRDLDLWGRIAGADSRLHLDPEWAGPRFGGTIVPAMLLIAIAAERLAATLGTRSARPRLAGAAVRIRSATHPGTVHLITAAEADGGVWALSCTLEGGVGVIDAMLTFGPAGAPQGRDATPPSLSD